MKQIIFIIFLYSFSTHAYLQKRGNSGALLSWPSTNINYLLNNSNCNSNIKNELLSITRVSANEWSQNTNLSLQVSSANLAPQSLRNDIVCSDNISSSAIVAVTKVIFNESNGQIIETDITINNNTSLSTESNDSNFVGNVLTHEFGHSIGFDHSEGFRNSMFYTLFLGQNTISSDDKAGGYALYPFGTRRGAIKGRIIGGAKRIGIFGAYVKAFSTDTGELMGSAVTLDDGSFNIKGLPIGAQYFLYVTPLELLGTISKYYSSARVDFCGGNANRAPYRGTFFSTCATTEGFPQGISLDVREIDVGEVSAYCELREIKLDRFEDEVSTFKDLELNGFSTQLDFGSTFVSYFTAGELKNSMVQEFEVNLDGIDIPEGDNFLDIKLNSQDFYSQIQLEMEIINVVTGATATFSSENADGSIKTKDGAPDLNLIGRMPLNIEDTSENEFTVKITARCNEFNEYLDPEETIPNPCFRDYGFSENDFFPDNKNFKDPIGFYFSTISISQLDNGSYKTIMEKDYGQITDNYSCPGAPRTLQISAITEETASSEKDSGVFSCNSIDTRGSGGGGGPLTFTLGFILVFLLNTRNIGKAENP